MKTIFLQGDSQQLKTKWYCAFQRLERAEEYVIGMVSGGVVIWPRALGQGRRSKQLALDYANRNALYGDMATDPREWITTVHGVNNTIDEITEKLRPIQDDPSRVRVYINDDSTSETIDDKATLNKWINRSRKEDA